MKQWMGDSQGLDGACAMQPTGFPQHKARQTADLGSGWRVAQCRTGIGPDFKVQRDWHVRCVEMDAGWIYGRRNRIPLAVFRRTGILR